MFIRLVGDEANIVIKLVNSAGGILRNTDFSLLKQVSYSVPGYGTGRGIVFVDPSENLKGAIHEIRQLVTDRYGNKAVEITDDAGKHLGIDAKDAGSLLDEGGEIANLLLSLRTKVGEAHWPSFAKDFEKNIEMLRKFDGEEGLVDSWKVVSDLPEGKIWVRQNRYILQKLTLLENADKIKLKEFYKSFTPNGSYPIVRDGVRFNEYGFPDFTGSISDKSHVVEILMDGSNNDYLKAYEKLKPIVGDGNIQFTTKYGSSFRIKRNGTWSDEIYTWHHHEDGKTMLPVLQDVHSSHPHTGGRSIVNSERNIKGFFPSPSL